MSVWHTGVPSVLNTENTHSCKERTGAVTGANRHMGTECLGMSHARSGRWPQLATWKVTWEQLEVTMS